MRSSVVSFCLAIGVCSSGVVLAQPAPADRGNGRAPAIVIDGSPVPVAPQTITRDERGRATVRALRLTAPLRIDGRLDEDVYASAPPFGGFVQVVPRYGQPSSENTDVWVSFDQDNIYVSARVHDSAPPEQWVANELRRDTNQLRNNDTFGVMFDTFYDRRSGFAFYTNALGALADYAIVDEGTPNTDWNPVWDVRTGRFDGGWTVEMRIPFKTLRYLSGSAQLWGVQMRRSIRRKNEWAYLNPVPQAMAGPQALNRVSSGGTLAGLDLPAASKNLELKPYALGKVTTDHLRTPPLQSDPDGDVGGDLKYGVTANLTADLTVNTDFAQVEVDEQQVNLTRFNIQLPEKRDFFLEGRGNFDFGRGGGGGGFFGNFGTGGGLTTTSDTPQVFYSRRIGLNRNRVIPILAGGRLTGKAGAWGLGLMNIQTTDEETSGTPDTNFTVLRLKRDILRRSTIGAIVTNRSQSALVEGGDNQAYGADASFAFYQNVTMGGYYAKTQTTNLAGDDESYQGRFDYSPDRYGARVEYLKVGREFNPEVGFLRRTDFRRSYGSLRFSPRPASSRWVRQYRTEGTFEYIVNGAGDLESRSATGRFGIEFESSDQLTVDAGDNFERLFRPFQIAPGVIIPVGSYSFNDATVSYSMGAQRRFSGTVAMQAGEFYDGTILALTLSSARLAILKQFSVEPSFSINRVELPAGDFTSKLYRARTDYGFSPRMFLSALLQWSSADNTFSSNVRYRWEYRPGSELFVVWTDEHDTAPHGPGLRNRAFVVKATRLFRF
jgi:hypothetical protein